MTLYDALIAPFVEFGFMRRALAGCIALSFGAAPIGVFLMLRRMSLIGDAMAHAILPGAAIGYLVAGFSLGAMTLGGLVAGFAVAVLAGVVARTTTLKEDTALAAFYIISLAAGVVLLSARGSNVDVLRVLFGSVLALDNPTLLLMTTAASLTLAGLALIARPLIMEFVDPGFLATVSRAGGVVHLMFLGLAALNLVASFHALGTLLAVGIMILPAAAARLWTRGLLPLFALAIALAIASCIAGLILSYHFSLATGPAIILTAGVIYLASLLFGAAGGALLAFWPRRHLQA